MAAILASAHAQLSEVGPGALSLRAIARDVGMVSSAVYRYVASRDELLTLLIIDAYNDLGAAVEDAEATAEPADLLGRWLAIAHGARDWALAHPNQYALIFGSPVPGYEAPEDTIGPASRIPRLMTALLAQARAPIQHPTDDHRSVRTLPKPASDALAPVMSTMAEDPVFTESAEVEAGVFPLTADDIGVGILAWTHLLGAVSAELFGHRTNVVAPEGRRAFFDYEMRVMADLIGVSPDE